MATRLSGKLSLPRVLSRPGLALAVRGNDGRIGDGIHRKNFLNQLIQPMGITGDDAEPARACQVLREQGPALHQAVGSRSYLLLDKQPAEEEACHDQSHGSAEDKLRSERDRKTRGRRSGGIDHGRVY